MPTDQQQQQPASPVGAPPAPSQIQSPASSSDRPQWLPEGFSKPEELATRYQDLDKRWKETEPRLKNLERWEKWGDPDQFEKNLATRIAERDKKIRADVEAELRSRQAPEAARDPFDGYELLDPRQQAEVLREQVAQGVRAEVEKLIAGRWGEAQGRLGEMDQRFSLLSRALSARAENPDLDLNGLWREASTLATGDQNKLFELAVERLLAPKKIEKQIAQAVAAEKAKWEQEASNKAQAALTGSGNGASASSFKETLAARKQGRATKESLRTQILQKMLASGELQPSQI